MFFNAEDDDQDFVSSGGSGGGNKLASLFGMDKASNQGGNESLTYTAPKQPKKKEPSPDGASAPAVLSASVVHAYKYVENQYASQGKLGIAILANHSAKDYRILLYRNKQQQITNAKLSPSFTFSIQANNYASFYDDARQSWSVMFEKEETLTKFAKDMAVSKANSVGAALDNVVMQDLHLGEGGELQVEDSAEIRYTGWLLTNHTFGQVFDTNASSDKLFRFKLGKGKVIKGWEAGVIGMKKGGRRLLVVPPSFGYGSQGMGNKIPANSTLIFDVEVVRVKLQKGDSPTPSPAPTAEPQPAAVEEDHSSESVKVRSQSITEHMAQSPKSDKAKLISRMAKMGQPMLPLAGAVAAQPEEEEGGSEEPPSPVPVSDGSNPQPIAQPKPVLASKPVPQPVVNPVPNMAQPITQPVMQQGMMGQNLQGQPAFVQNLPAAQQLSVFQPNNILQQQQAAAMAMQQQQNMSAFQPPSYQYQQQQPYQGLMFAGAPTPAPTPGAPSQVDNLAPVLLTESRQQNTEVRLSISKMGDKIDRILEKMNLMGQGMPGMSVMQSMQSMHSPTMETGILLQNITRIVQENETLKKDVYEKSAKIESQNEKIAGLLQKNQKFVEQSNTLLEERNEGYKFSASQSQARVLALEQEKVNLATELSTASAQLSSLQLELATSRKKEAELRQTLQTSADAGLGTKDELDRLKMQRLEDEKRINDLSTSLREEKQFRKNIETEKNNLQEEFDDMKSAYNTMEKNLNERKRKANEERRRMEEELEDMKINLEGEIQSLRDKLRKQKTNTDVVTADKTAKLEEDIGAEWQKKCDKLLKAASDKHERALRDVKEEKQELVSKIQELETKLQTLKSSSGSSGQRISQLEEQVEELSVWKDKYDNLRSQATSMKERYEERISELEEEKDQIEERVQTLQTQIQKLKQVVAAGGTATAAAATPVSGDVVSEVKKIMNSVYRGLRDEFDAEESYTGIEVLNAILAAIKTTTLELVQRQQSEGKTEEEEEEEEEDEDEDDVEDEEEETEKEPKEPEPVVETVTETIPESDVNKSDSSSQPSQIQEPVVETLTQTTSSVTETSPEPVLQAEDLNAAPHTEGPGLNTSEPEEEPSVKSESEPLSVPESSGDSLSEDEIDMPRSGKKKGGTVQPKMTKATNQPTGDKGNPYHKKELDKAGSVEPMMTSSKSEALKSEPSSKTPVQPKMTKATNQPTGDKGNPYHKKELDKAGSVEPMMTSSKSQLVKSEPISKLKNQSEPDTVNQLSSSSCPQGKSALIEPMMSSNVSQALGDKGNPHHKAELDKAGEKSKKSKQLQPSSFDPLSSGTDIIEPMMSSSIGQALGDKGNPSYKKSLDKLTKKETNKSDASHLASPEKLSHDEHGKTNQSEKSSDSFNSQSEQSKPPSDISSSNVTPSQSADSLQTDSSHSSSNTDKNSVNNNQPDKTETKPVVDNQSETGKTRTNSTSSGKQSRSGSTLSQSDALPTLVSREPPPLFEDDDDKDDDSPLFGSDTTVADTFGTKSTSEVKDQKKNDTKSSKLPTKTDLMDDGDSKAPPPPLFGDDDDDDELDWLSG